MKPFRIALFAVLALFVFSKSNAALNGVYTINPALPASVSNYLTFASAVSDMQSGTRADGGPVNGPAVNGAVTFNVAPGTYNERINMVGITGASAVNTITFNGGNASLVTLTYNSTLQFDATVYLNGADWIRLTNMTIGNTGVQYGYGICMVLQADNNQVTNCVISLPITATDNYKACFIAGDNITTYNNAANNTLIENNTFIGGSRSVVMNGGTSIYSSNNVIKNNTMSQAYAAGVFMNYQLNPLIEANTITLRNQLTTSYGMYLRFSGNMNINRNRIYETGTYGIYMQSINQTVGTPTYIRNNMIGGTFFTTTTAYGLYVTGAANLNVYHNSMHVAAGNPTAARPAFFTGTLSGIDLRNNSLSTTVNGASAYAMYCASTTVFTQLDYNNYYCLGANLVYFGGNQTTLAGWQTAFPALNGYSLVGDPGYAGTNDLHVSGPQLNNVAFNIPTEIVDFDGQTRPLPPDLIKDIGADEINVAATDIDVFAITSPLSASVGPNTVAAEFRNNGSGSLNGLNVPVQYSTNGGATWSTVETFTPTTMGTPGSSQIYTFTNIWNLASAGNFNVCVRVATPLPGDPDATDQLCNNICTGMSGVYTLNPGFPTGGTNFNNFSDLSTALGSCGISGPTTVNVAPGTYSQAVVIPVVLGSSATNTLTIDGGNATACTLSVSLSTINSSVFKFDGSDYVRVLNMSVHSTGVYGFGFHLTNNANYNEIKNCKVQLPNTSTSVYHIGILIAGATYSTYSDNGDYNLFENNEISGGYYGVRMNGTSTSIFDINNKVINNQIRDYYYYGVYSYYVESPEIIGNTITPRATASTANYGIYLYYADKNFKVNNNVVPSAGSRVLYCFNCNASGTGVGSISNNMFGGTFTGTGNVYGVYMSNTTNTNIWNNSISLGNANGYALYVTGAGNTYGLNLRNNILAVFGYGTTYALYAVGAGHFASSNYNVFYTQGSNFIYHNGVYPTLAAYQTAYPTQDQNSVSAEPLFVAVDDLHLVCSHFDNLGTPITAIVTDIDGQPRSATTPDIGADEYSAISVSVNLGPDTSSCGTVLLEVDSIWTNVVWNNGAGNGFQFYANLTGTYSVFVSDSNNCRAEDSLALVILPVPTPVYQGDTISQCITTPLDAQNTGSDYLWSNGDTTQVTYASTPGWYNVTVTNTSGCAIEDSVMLSFYAQPLVNLGNDTTFCLGGSIAINAGAQPFGSTISWSNGATTQVIVVSAPDTFSVNIVTPFGCTDSDTLIVFPLNSPVVNLGPDFTYCGPAATLNADPGGNNPGASYLWSNSASGQIISVSTSGTYTVTATNPNGCQTIDDVVVTVTSALSVNLGPDAVVCNGQSLVLDAGYPGYNHLWSNNATTQSITITQPSTYIAYVTDPGTGCQGSDTIVVIASPYIFNLGPDQVLCAGSTMTLDAGFGGTSYTWSNGGNGQTTSISTGGTYSVSVIDPYGCNATDQIVITQLPAPAAAFAMPGTTPLWAPVQFTDQSTGATSWSWDFGDGSVPVTTQNPVYNFQAMGTFTVCLTVSNGGCTSTICQNITVGPPIGVDDEELANGISVYPNPGNGLFNLNIDLSASTDLYVEVYSVHGKHILSQEIAGAMSQQEMIDLTSSGAGIYLLHIRTADDREIIRKLVIQ